MSDEPTDFNDLAARDPEAARARLVAIDGGKAKPSAAAKAAAPKPPKRDEAGPFFTDGAQTYWQKGPENEVRLALFSARIAEQRIADDGTRQEVRFAIEGQSPVGALPRVEIPAGRFSTMSWPVEHWGHRAVIMPGNGTKDALRAAIQMLSADAPTVTVYQHTGWRRMDGAWRYLHAAGALGADGTDDSVTVEIGDAGANDRLNFFTLPPAPAGNARRDATRAALDMLDISERPPLGFLLIAAAARAPLAHASPVDFAIHIAGRTGAKKSEATALLQQCFGAQFNARAFAASFEDTPATLLKKAHRAKDAVLVIDDFRPRGSQRDIERQHAEVDRLIRAAGNQSGRGRQTKDMESRVNHYPRGLVVTTGEDSFRGHSLRARLLIYEAQPAEVRLDVLTRLQAAGRSGALAQAMAAYLAWLAPQMDSIGDDMRREVQTARDALPPMAHPRGLDIYASLYSGARRFFDFAAAAGAIDADRAKALKAEADCALRQLLRDQSDLQDEADEVTIFIEVLRAALATGAAHLRAADTGKEPIGTPGAYGWTLDTSAELDRWTRNGDCIGFADHEHVYLYPGPAYALAVRLASAQGHSIGVGQRTLFTRMKERNLLAATEGGPKACTARKRCHGVRESFVWITKDAFGNA
jgi:hypothetical protein